MLEKTLSQLGLNKNEIQAYLVLLQLGTVPASTLGKRIHLPRSTAKYTCEQLTEKGIVTSSNKNNSVFYTAKDPDSLKSLIKKEKELLTNKEDNLNRIIGELKNLFTPHIALPRVQFFEGADNIKKMFEDVLKEGAAIYGCLKISEEIDPEIINYLREEYTPRRIRLRNPAWMIFNDTQETRKYQENDQKVNRISLLVPEKNFPFEACFHIYGGKVAFYSYAKNDLTGVIIENSNIQKSQSSLFRLAWNYARLLKANSQYKNVDI